MSSRVSQCVSSVRLERHALTSSDPLLEGGLARPGQLRLSGEKTTPGTVVQYLVHCTNEPNVSIPQLANLLIERTQNTNWVVVFKGLITVHHLMCYGNERFTQYLASSNSSFQLSNFLDKSGVQGYDMSPFIRRYAKYLNEKAMSYRTVAFDFCKVKRGKEDGVLRTMNSEKLLKTLPVLQSQLDELLEFDCTAADLSNGVINMAFMLLFRDLIRLFAGYNDSIINLLEKYFEMNKKQCRQALDLYKKFLIRMDRVGEFLKVAENVGIDKGEIPDLTKAPSSLLEALEQHLAALEGKKGSAANTPTQSASQRTDVKSGVSALANTSTSFGSAAAHNVDPADDAVRMQALLEEEAVINHYKSKVQSPTNTGGAPAASATNPFLINSPTQPIVDLFGAPVPSAETQSQPTKALDDLLQLGNPFADMFGAPGAPGAVPGMGQQMPGAPMGGPPQMQAGAPQSNNMWMSNGFGAAAPTQQPVQQSAAFVSDSAFSSVFGPSDPNLAAAQAGAEPSTGKVLTGDLDSSLALLAENLTINKGGQQAQKGMQWNSPKNTAKPGGTANWTPQPMAATTGANYRPMSNFKGCTIRQTAPPAASQPQDGQSWPGQGMMGSPMFTNVHQMVSLESRNLPMSPCGQMREIASHTKLECRSLNGPW
ncbi:unnamed protein product [Nesidiocoris tenuis]|uniref:ENTH domain-containing protein n=1 Tax=Nesidiocoris tenuis TaxID=355587 RepID=A0A6H5GYN3_9HEMI|nr:unnamed protein product [Nesidiocoris tenuis]